VRGIVTGVSSPPAITNFRGRIEAATRTPLTARGNAPGSTVLIARMTERSAAKGFSLASLVLLLAAMATSLATNVPSVYSAATSSRAAFCLIAASTFSGVAGKAVMRTPMAS
jgi:hypothetical protein